MVPKYGNLGCRQKDEAGVPSQATIVRLNLEKRKARFERHPVFVDQWIEVETRRCRLACCRAFRREDQTF